MENHGKKHEVSNLGAQQRTDVIQPQNSNSKRLTDHLKNLSEKKRFFGGLSLIDIDDGLPSQYNINTAIWEETHFLANPYSTTVKNM